MFKGVYTTTKKMGHDLLSQEIIECFELEVILKIT